MAKWSHLPVAMQNGELLPHMSAKLRTQTIDAVFEGAGGHERMLAWVEKSDANYGEFLKIWAKGAVRSSNVEIGASEGVENLLDRLDQLDRSENAKIINTVAREVEDAA